MTISEKTTVFFLHGLPIPIFEHLTITIFDRSVIESFKFCTKFFHLGKSPASNGKWCHGDYNQVCEWWINLSSLID